MLSSFSTDVLLPELVSPSFLAASATLNFAALRAHRNYRDDRDHLSLLAFENYRRITSHFKLVCRGIQNQVNASLYRTKRICYALSLIYPTLTVDHQHAKHTRPPA